MRPGLGVAYNPLRKFQSTHPVRGATIGEYESGEFDNISIHAPREGCDKPFRVAAIFDTISIHAPREGCD